LVAGAERAAAAPLLEVLDQEHERIARRSRSFEEALRRRLTDRPREELLAARRCLAEGGEGRRAHAAGHVARATELLREIVRRLRVPEDWIEADRSLAATLERTAHRARVRAVLDADDLDDVRAGVLIERVAEEVMLDAPARSEVVVRVRRRRGIAAMAIELERLPSPVAVALIEELALAAGASVSYRPESDGVRLLLEVPCGS
jgi:hypothetical protein